MTFFKADYLSGKLEPVEGKKFRNGVIAIGNTRYKLEGESAFSSHASFHLSYYKAKDDLLKELISRQEKALKDAQQIEKMINFVQSNF